MNRPHKQNLERGSGWRECINLKIWDRGLDETAPLAPLNLYAATKAAAEMALGSKAAEGLQLMRLRPFNHTGPGQSEDFVVPAFAGQIARIEAGLAPPIMAVGALHPEREFPDFRDICNAYIGCIHRLHRKK